VVGSVECGIPRFSLHCAAFVQFSEPQTAAIFVKASPTHPGRVLGTECQSRTHHSVNKSESHIEVANFGA